MTDKPKSPKGITIVEHEVQVDFTPLPLPAHLAPSPGASPTIQPLVERRGSRLISGWQKRQVHLWRAPSLMAMFFLLGFCFSVAHCVFYPKLRGGIVGNSDQQEEKIRFGTAFAFLAQILLGASVWTAYTQWLWRTVKRKTLTISAWNDAFSADTSVLSLFNLEMLRKLRVASIMACFAWSLLLPPFFTPATLFVHESTNIIHTTADMPYPAIAVFNQSRKFSYSPPANRGTTQFLDDTSRFFTGPRTALNLITTATASLGEILPLDLPYNNSAYSITFLAPIVKCTDAEPEVIQKISSFLQQGMETILDSRKETDSAYYAFVPTYDSTGNLTAAWHPRSQTPSRPLNELWMTFLRPEINAGGERVKPRHYQVCKVHNATYNVTISQYHGVQRVLGNATAGAVIPFPDDHPDKPSDMVQHSYTAFMWSLCDQLVGKMAWFNETTNLTSSFYAAPQFGVIDSPIQRTSLLGSRDLDAFFEMDEEKKLYDGPNDVFNLSDQRLRDKAMARNETLAVLIEELSFNVTVGLMHNRLLTNMSSTPVQLTNDVNRYSYKPYGLFIPYILANIFSFVCLCIGLVSCYRDGVLPGRKVQDIIYAARNPAIHRHASIDVRKMSLTAKSDLNGDLELGIVLEPEQKSASTSRRMSSSAKGNTYSMASCPR